MFFLLCILSIFVVPFIALHHPSILGRCYCSPFHDVGRIFRSRLSLISSTQEGELIDYLNCPVVYVKTDQQCRDAVSALSKLKIIGLDLEFDRNRFSYGLTLCLVQIYGAGSAYIFDPLSQVDLKSVYSQIIENADITKVIHNPSEDIRILRIAGFSPRNIFDTEVAVKLLNHELTGLSAVVSSILGINLDKSNQVSNWIRRPLSTEQLVYAKLDVAVLLPLHSRLMQLAAEKGVVHWLEEENQSLDVSDEFCSREDNTGGGDIVTASKKEMASFSPYTLNIYTAMLRLRDKYARGASKPPHFIISKENMYELLSHFAYDKEPQRLTLRKLQNVHPVVKSPAFEKEFNVVIKQAHDDAKSKNLTMAVVREKSREDDRLRLARRMKLLPLQRELANLYGNATARHLLPFKVLDRIIATGAVHIQDVKFEYRKKLFEEVINSLNIDLRAEGGD